MTTRYLLIFQIAILISACYSTEIVTQDNQDTGIKEGDCLKIPVAYISPDREAIPGESINLYITPHPLVCRGEILAYEWSQISGPTVHLTNNSSDSTSFVVPPEYEDIILRVRIISKTGKYEDTIKIKVVDKLKNKAPIADADGDVILPDRYNYKSSAYYSQGKNKAEMSYLWINPDDNQSITISSRYTAETEIMLTQQVTTPQIILLEVIENELHSTRDIKLVRYNSESRRVELSPRLYPEAGIINANPGETVELKIKAIDTYPGANIEWIQLMGEKVNIIKDGQRAFFIAPNRVDEMVFVAYIQIENLFSPPVVFRVNIGNPAGIPLPMADAGADRKAKTLSYVKLNGSNSSVGFPRKIKYNWRQVYGNSITLHDSDTAFPYFTAPRIPGKIIILLTVSDGYIESRPDSVIIDISNN